MIIQHLCDWSARERFLQEQRICVGKHIKSDIKKTEPSVEVMDGTLTNYYGNGQEIKSSNRGLSRYCCNIDWSVFALYSKGY